MYKINPNATNDYLKVIAGEMSANEFMAIHSPEDYVKASVNYVIGLKRYMYMVTFTVRPDCKYTEDHIEQLIEKTSKRTALNIVNFEYVKEYRNVTEKTGFPVTIHGQILFYQINI